jgi:sodium-dependent dicarboxylate transporter 2/3/5
MTINSSSLNSELQRASYQNVGLVLGPLVFAFMLLFDNSQNTMPLEAWRTAAIAVWMAIWWATEAVPVPVTAFLPLVTFELLGISDFKDTAAPFANPIIFLFMGAFFLAIAVERWNLHKRIALYILSKTGTNGSHLIAGFMLVAALLSMWMTNTSTTMMLLPISISVVQVLMDNVDNLGEKQRKDFQAAMLLSLAYGATIGGLATLIGTPPNALLAAFLAEHYDIHLDFVSWMAVGVPVSAIMLPLAWLTLTKLSFKVDIQANESVKAHLSELRKELGPMSTAEKRVAVIFLLVVCAWMTRGLLMSTFGFSGLSDAGIVMAAALLLFLLPSKSTEQYPLLTWQDANRVPWGVLILFGGGLSLAAAVSDSGLAHWLGESLLPLTAFGVIALIIAATAMVIFLTEMTSNVATTATFLPVVAAIALQADLSPLLLTVPITLAASCAFMLPVATPPNAIVFASGMLTIPQMIRSGLILNLVGMVLLSVVAIWWAPWILA